jgi:hypothetical protein
MVGMLTGRNYFTPGAVKTAGLLPDVFKQAVDLSLEPSTKGRPVATASDCNECPGHPNEWNPTTIHMVVRPPLQKEDLRQAEVAVFVPENVRVAFDESEYSSGQLLVIPVRNVGDNGEWQTQVRWRAMRPGRYDAWVETRCEGTYQHRPIVFNVVP